MRDKVVVADKVGVRDSAGADIDPALKSQLPAALDADGGLKVHLQNTDEAGLTDAQLRATPVPVSGPVTDAQLRATAVPVSGPLTDAQLRAAAVPVSAASLPLPSGAATETTLAGVKTAAEGTRDRLPAALTAGGGVKAGLVDALPAGSNNIGDVDVLTAPGTVANLSSSLPSVVGVVAGYDGSNVRVVKTDSSGRPDVTLSAALPTGTNTIGKVRLQAVRDDTSTGTVAEDDVGDLRLTSQRALHVSLRVEGSGDERLPATSSDTQAIRDRLPAAFTSGGGVKVGVLDALPAGNNNIGDVDIASSLPAGSNNIGDVDVLTLPGGIVGKAEDSAASDGDVGVPVLGVRNDSGTARTSTNGDYSHIVVDSAGRVGIADLGGSITVDAASLPLPTGAATETTLSGVKTAAEGTRDRLPAALTGGGGVKAGLVDALPAGNNNIGDVDVASLPALPAGTNNIGDVDVLSLPALPAGSNNIGDVDVLTLPALPAGNNNIGDVDVASLPALPAGTNNIGDVDVLSLPALPAGTNNIGDVDVVTLPGSLTGKAEDAQAVSADVGLPILGVRNDAAAPKTTDDGDYGMLALDSAGRLGIADLGGSITVDAASLPLPTGASTETTLAGVKTATENTRDRLPAALTAGGGVKAGIVDALPAGSNNIGDVDVLTLPALPAGTNNIGDVDVLSLPALPAGNNNIGDVDVASLPALPAGTNNIGDVDVLSLPALPAGNNNIGDVDVLSLPALPAGSNTIGKVDVGSNHGASNVDAAGAWIASTASDQTWTTLTPTGGRKVREHLVRNKESTSATNKDMELGFGASTKHWTVKPGEIHVLAWNGALHLRSATNGQTVAFEVVTLED